MTVGARNVAATNIWELNLNNDLCSGGRPCEQCDKVRLARLKNKFVNSHSSHNQYEWTCCTEKTATQKSNESQANNPAQGLHQAPRLMRCLTRALYMSAGGAFSNISPASGSSLSRLPCSPPPAHTHTPQQLV